MHHVPVGALFAPTSGLHFQILHTLSFLFIYTLHWYKHRTRLEVAASLRKFPLTAHCVDAGYGGVLLSRTSWCAYCANKGFAFSGSPSPCFLLICTLHWCRHCTRLVEAASLRKFPLTALCVDVDTEVLCRPIPVGALFTPTRGLHFLVLHPLSFPFICTLFWRKHCTRVVAAASFSKFRLTAQCVDA